MSHSPQSYQTFSGGLSQVIQACWLLPPGDSTILWTWEFFLDHIQLMENEEAWNAVFRVTKRITSSLVNTACCWKDHRSLVRWGQKRERTKEGFRSPTTYPGWHALSLPHSAPCQALTSTHLSWGQENALWFLVLSRAIRLLSLLGQGLPWQRNEGSNIRWGWEAHESSLTHLNFGLN